ncbi:MAG: hypothetical protein IT349_14440 [Candidatus Eisenbacteria bacterium]|nr:hypothetical protein [Candidatus Eisenbacteria bacterium]
MYPTRSPLRQIAHCALLAATVIASGPAHARVAESRVIGGLFRGALESGLPFELHVSRADSEVVARLVHHDPPGSWNLRGPLTPDGSFRLEPTSDDSAPDFAAWEGTFRPDGLVGRWIDQDGTVREHTMERYADLHLRRHARLEVEASYPLFRSSFAAHGEINAAILRAVEESFAQRVAVLDGLATAFAIEDSARVEWLYGATQVSVRGQADGVVSLLFRQNENDGGDHNEAWLESLNLLVEGDHVRPILLHELSRPEANLISHLSSVCLTDLKRQGASRIVDGSVSAFGQGLRVWTATPRGLCFHFPPEAVDHDAAVPFEVVIPYQEIEAFLRPGAAVQRLRAHGADETRIPPRGRAEGNWSEVEATP